MRVPLLSLMLALAPVPGLAQSAELDRLPVPRFVSLKAATANVRRGPGIEHRIDWRFQHRGMPLRVVAQYDNWRRVVDDEGLGGWVHFMLLSGNRTVTVGAEGTALHEGPDAATRRIAVAQPGAILRLGPCDGNWCEVTADGLGGYAPREALWGTDADLDG